MPFAANVLELIGNTPMIEVRRFDTGPCRLFPRLRLRLIDSGKYECCRE